MIQHKVSISLARESVAQESSSFENTPKTKTSVHNHWQIVIAGDLEHDNPMQAYKLLEELQSQIDKIRNAYQ